MLQASLLLAACGFLGAAAFSPIYNGQLNSEGLLGSHFGHVGTTNTFDYVVVGGGTAGLAIARRLAASNTVAVVEAGGFYELDSGNLTEIPADVVNYLGKNPLYKNPLIDWQQYTAPQAGFNGVTTLYPSGHTLGGGSARNFLCYQRGSAGSYRRWADDVGDDSYTFENLLPHFKKSVRFAPPSPERAKNSTPWYDSSAFDGGGGPLRVSYPNYASPAASWVTQGMDEIGIKHVDGMENGNLFGWAWFAQTIDFLQVRSSSASSFLREALEETSSLQVYKNTLAKKILFDSNKKATSVEVESIGVGSGSVTFTLNAKKEVILSSGAFRSPQLLMVSGIGPASTLHENNIPVIADLPGVGQNMWDHIYFCVSYPIEMVTHSWLGNPGFSAAATKEYRESRTGILTNTGADIVAFQNLPEGLISTQTAQDLTTTFGDDWPNIELLTLDAYVGDQDDLLLGLPEPNNITSVCAVVVSPFSRGEVTIASSDTGVHPIVDPNWLGDARDQEVAIAAFKQARSIFQTDAMEPILVGEEAFPGPEVTTDEDILKFIKTSSQTIFHAAGTCRMGKTSDPMAVVDSQARVIGVRGLRVVDASAFALLPPGHPQATVYALAEKIAAIILSEV